MKNKTFNKFILTIIASISFCLPSYAFSECTQEQALNKMMALGRAKQERQKKGGTGSVVNLTVDIAKVGKVLADKNYSLACQKYDQIATKHKVDLNQKMKGMVTMEEMKKDGGKGNGSCSQSDASKKMMGYMNQLEDKVALGDTDSSQIKLFSNDIGKFGDLIYTNPSQYCSKLDGLKAKYNLK